MDNSSVRMNELCDSFIENRDIISKTFFFESSYIYPVCASIFTDKGEKADKERLISCRNLLKSSTGVFSNFRGTAKLTMISMLTADDNPNEKMQNSLLVYDALKKRFFSSQFLPVAAMIIAGLADPSKYDDIALRTREIYELMQKEHPLLTAREDSVFAALLALSPMTNKQVSDETECCYKLMKEKFHSSNAVQTLSHVLALGEGKTEEKCRRTADIYDELKRNGCNYGKTYELATLGVLALLPADVKEIADSVAKTSEYLSEKKGYGILGVGKKQRHMHAAMLTVSDYLGRIGGGREAVLHSMNTAAISAVISIIAAQQAAICAAVAASSAASASASS